MFRRSTLPQSAGRTWRNCIPPKCRCVRIRLHGVVTRMTAIWIFSAVRTSNLISDLHWKHFTVRHCNCEQLRQEQGFRALFVPFAFIQRHHTCASLCMEQRPWEADSYTTQELAVAQIVKKFPAFQGEPEGSPPCSQEPATGPYTLPPYFLKIHFNTIPPPPHSHQVLPVPTKYSPYRRMFQIEVVDINVMLYYVTGMLGDVISYCVIQWSLFGGINMEIVSGVSETVFVSIIRDEMPWKLHAIIMLRDTLLCYITCDEVIM
jgi:hypothetical protein